MLQRSRPGHPRRRYRARFRRFLVANRIGLAGLVGCYAVGMVIMALFNDGYFLGFIQGFFTMALIALVLIGFISASGSLRHVTGAWGEDNTRDVLKWAKRRRLIYGWIDNLEIQGGDIDHLVATSNGWIAIDSKWHSTDLDATVIAGDADRTLRAARRAQLVLRSLKHSAEVRPLAVIWGGSRDDIPDGAQSAHGVEFVSGSHLKRWLRDQPQGDHDKHAARAYLRELTTFRHRVRPPDYREPSQRDAWS